LNELVDRAGCQLLCDVSNVYLSAHTMGYDAHGYLDGLPCEARLVSSGIRPSRPSDRVRFRLDSYTNGYTKSVDGAAFVLIMAKSLNRFRQPLSDTVSI
jgi:hypothetical protein